MQAPNQVVGKLRDATMRHDCVALVVVVIIVDIIAHLQ